MFSLTLGNAVHKPARTALTILAIAAILAEILVLEGFLTGSYTQLRQAVLQRGGDVIVSQKGVTNFLAARSILPQRARRDVESRPGVASAHPLTSISAIYEADGRLTPIIVLVYDDKGGPSRLIAGRAPRKSREIVIDRSLAERYGLSVGDTLTLSAYDFTVSGIADGAAALFTPFAFLTYDGLIDFYFESDVAADIAAFPLLSFLMVDVKKGFSPAAVAADISANVPEASAILPAQLAANDENLGRELLGPIMNLLLGLSYGIGALAIGLFSYAAVRTRRKSLGVLRALGFDTRHLVIGVMTEALGTVVLAIPLGIAIGAGLGSLIESLAPVYMLQTLDPTALWRTALIALVLAVLGALAPLGSLMRLDPATAFRG